MNPIDLFMQTHPEIGLCFYDLHNDGSGVFYSSRLRPIVNMQPKHIGHLGGAGSNLWQFNADTHILDWLQQLDQPFDVIADEDLEAEGSEVLEGYRAVITGTHIQSIILPGCWIASRHIWMEAGALCTLEAMGSTGEYPIIRRCQVLLNVENLKDGIRAFAPLPGEFYSSFTGEYTGLWRRNGRPPNEFGWNRYGFAGIRLLVTFTLCRGS